jgi:hypothetical protein
LRGPSSTPPSWQATTGKKFFFEKKNQKTFGPAGFGTTSSLIATNDAD